MISVVYFLDDTFATIQYNKTTNEMVTAFGFKLSDQWSSKTAKQCEITDYLFAVALFDKDEKECSTNYLSFHYFLENKCTNSTKGYWYFPSIKNNHAYLRKYSDEK